jgi:hypothetical protein
MSKRQPQRVASAGKRADSAAALRRALAQQTKADLINLLLDFARKDRGIHRQLTARFDVAATAEELAAATQLAIADATDFDERDINRNFDYDDEAYGEVKRNLGRLIDAGELPWAMQLALDLMQQASYQVEMSDEGLMTHDIEDCLSVVFKALQRCNLPADTVTAWCSAMLDSDRVKFIAVEQLQSLRHRFQRTAAR